MKPIFALTAICAALMMSAMGQKPSDHDRATTIVDNALKSKNPETRKEGVKALKTVADQDAFAARLEAMFNDKDVPVRIAAVEAVAGMKSERRIPALKIALDDSVAEVRFAAATALFKLHDPAGREFLMDALSRETKISSGTIASHIRDAKRTMQIPSAMMTIALKQGVSMAPVPYLGMGFSAMEEAMANRGVSGRAATALLFGKQKDSAVIAALEEALTDKEAAVRAAAVESLALIAAEADLQEVAAMVAPLLQDKNQAVRVHAAASYLRLEAATEARIVVGE
jgi:HEAT repeat protein